MKCTRIENTILQLPNTIVLQGRFPNRYEMGAWAMFLLKFQQRAAIFLV